MLTTATTDPYPKPQEYSPWPPKFLYNDMFFSIDNQHNISFNISNH